jgi:hypothetical protein
VPKRADHEERRGQVADALQRVAAARGLHATGMREAGCLLPTWDDLAELSQACRARGVLRKAAFGAVTLASIAYPGAVSTVRENIAGAKVLTGATGLTGKILSGKGKVKLTGQSVAEIADEVLPALSAAVAALNAIDLAEADTFRAIVTTAIEQAVATGSGPNPAQTLMIGKIRAALGTPA